MMNDMLRQQVTGESRARSTKKSAGPLCIARAFRVVTKMEEPCLTLRTIGSRLVARGIHWNNKAQDMRALPWVDHEYNGITMDPFEAC